MQALQVHYTSCRHGTLGEAGFQIRAYSKGLEPEELQEIRTHSGYRRPLSDLPPPSALRAYPLTSGRYAITHIHYIGTDYSDRQGNFFAHTLVFPSQPLPHLPLEYLAWSGWKLKLADEEDEKPPESLPAMTVELAENNPYSRDELVKFMQEQLGQERLSTMLQAIFLGKTNSRTLVLRGDIKHTTKWLACVYQCFPPQLAYQLDVSTYEFSPKRLPCLAATTLDTEITLDETERNYQFYVFDDIEQKDSVLTEQQGELAILAKDYASLATTLFIQGDTLDNFFTFLNKLQYQTINKDIGAFASIYALAFNIIEMDNLIIREIAQSVLQNTLIINYPELTEGIQTQLQQLAEKTQSFDDWQLFIQYVLALHQQKPLADAVIETLCSAWLAALIAAVQENNLSATQRNAVEAVLEAQAEIRQQAYAQLIQAESIEKLASQVFKLSAQNFVYLIHLVLQALKSNQQIPVFAQEAVHRLLAAITVNPAVLKQVLAELLEKADTKETLCEICNAALQIQPTNQNLIIELLANLKAPWFLEEARRTCLPVELVIAELRTRLQNTTDRVGVYLHYLGDILESRNNDVLVQGFLEIAKYWALQIKDENLLHRLAEGLLEQRYLEKLLEENLTAGEQCIQVLNRRVSLDASHNVTGFTYQITLLADKYKITLKPNRIKIRLLIEYKTRSPGKQELDKLKSDILALDKNDYSLVATQLLQRTFNESGHIQIDQHDIVLSSLYVEDHLYFEILKKVYLDWLKHILPKLTADKKLGFIGFVHAWLQRDTRKASGKFMQSIDTEVMPLFVKKTLKHRGMCSVQISNLKDVLTGKGQERLEQFHQQLKTASPGLLGKVKNWFS